MKNEASEIRNQILKQEKFKTVNVAVEWEEGIATLSGEVESWQTVIDLGHFVAKLENVVNVVNHLTVKGLVVPQIDYESIKILGEEIGEIRSCDVVIIGAGISGCGIARELSKYNLKTIVVERNTDISEEATKANNGDIHPGHKAKPGTLKAKLNVKGNEMYTKWAEELNFELKRVGAMTIAYNEEDMKPVNKIYEDAIANGVPGIQMLTGEEIKKREPNVMGDPIGGIFAPTMGLVEPYLVSVALAENAMENGVEFILGANVADIIVKDGKVQGVVTSKGIIRAPYVINAAGVYADDISRMAGDEFYTIHGRRGTILILDKKLKGLFGSSVGVVPKSNNEESKGGGSQSTVEGNVLLGPSAREIPDKEDKAFDQFDVDYAFERGSSVSDKLKRSDIIAIFSGVRPADYTEDFIIEKSKKVDGFIHCAGIQSPGLASAPAIAELVENILKEDIEAKGGIMELKNDFNPIRKNKVEFRHLSKEEQDQLIKENPKYGHIICRCEQITEGEILDALDSKLQITTVDAIKRRTRSGMGRCQGGFCQPRILEILARENKQDWTDITLKGDGTHILAKDSRTL